MQFHHSDIGAAAEAELLEHSHILMQCLYALQVIRDLHEDEDEFAAYIRNLFQRITARNVHAQIACRIVPLVMAVAGENETGSSALDVSPPQDHAILLSTITNPVLRERVWRDVYLLTGSMPTPTQLATYLDACIIELNPDVPF